MAVNNVDVLIKSIFDSKGVQEARSQLGQLGKASQLANKQLSGFRQLQGIGNMAAETKKANEFLGQFNAQLGKGGAIIRKDGMPFSPGHWDKVSKSISGAMASGDYNNFESSIEKTNRAASEQAETLRNVAAQVNNGYIPAFKQGMKVGTNFTTKMKFGLISMSQHFDMAMLSAMFFGMQIMNIGRRLGTTLISTFTDIAGANNKAVQALSHLQAGFTVLKFTLGEVLANALMPLIPTLLNVIDKVIRWIDENPELTKNLLLAAAAATAFGAALFFISQARLGIAGLAGVAGLFIPGKAVSKKAGQEAAEAAAKGAQTSLDDFATAGAKKMAGPFATAWNTIKNKSKSWIDDFAKAARAKFPKTANFATKTFGSVGKVFSTGWVKAIGKFGSRVIPIVGWILLALDAVKILGNLFSAITPTLNKWLDKLGIVGNIIRIIWNLLVSGLNVMRSWISIIWDGLVAGFQWTKDLISSILDSLGPVGDAVKGIAGWFDGIADKSEELVKNTDATADALAKGDNTFTGAPGTATTASAAMNNPAADIAKETEQAAEKQKVAMDDVTKSMDKATQAQKMYSLSAENLNDIDLDQLNATNEEYMNFAKTLGQGTEDTPGVIPILEEAAEKITGAEGINSALGLWVQKMELAAATIVDTFIPQVSAAATALNENASAASSAASAQRKYNKAVAGED